MCLDRPAVLPTDISPPIWRRLTNWFSQPHRVDYCSLYQKQPELRPAMCNVARQSSASSGLDGGLVLQYYSLRLLGINAFSNSSRHALFSRLYALKSELNCQYDHDIPRFSASALKKVVHLILEPISALRYAPNSPIYSGTRLFSAHRTA